jgi:hypothetical protein
LWRGFAYANSDCHSHSDGHCDSNGHGNRNYVRLTNSQSHSHRDTNIDTVRKMYSDAAASSDSSASTLRVETETQFSSGTREVIREFPETSLCQTH